MNPIVIQANEEGRRAIQALCDVALKTGGLQNLPTINQILCSVKLIPPQEIKPEETLVPKKIQKKLGGLPNVVKEG